MAATTLRSSLNTYSTAVTGGTTPADSIQIKFSNWAKALEPWKTPLLDKVGFGPPIDQPIFYFGDSFRPSIEGTVAAGALGSGVTTLNVTAGQGVRFQKYMVLALFDFQAAPNGALVDPATKELVWVSAEPSTDALTIVRAQGGTSTRAFAAGAKVLVVGTAEPQNQFHTIASVTRGSRSFNYFQRFEGGVSADKAAQNMPTYEHATNPMLSDFESETLKQKRLLERSLWYGGRQIGAPSTPTPAMMGGSTHSSRPTLSTSPETR